MDYRIDFESLEWQSPMAGIQYRAVQQDGRQLRLVEYRREMEPHWCDRGHIGYLIDGRLEIEVAGERLIFGPGDGVFLPAGETHRHRATVLSERVLAVFVEDV